MKVFEKRLKLFQDFEVYEKKVVKEYEEVVDEFVVKFYVVEEVFFVYGVKIFEEMYFDIKINEDNIYN